jgi:hypothetical protein
LAKFGVEMIAPHRRNRPKPRTHDGRPMHRYGGGGTLNGSSLGWQLPAAGGALRGLSAQLSRLPSAQMSPLAAPLEV